MWSNRNSHSWLLKMKQLLCKTVWQFLTKLNILLPYDMAIMLLDIYSKELETYVYTNTCTQVFIAVFTHNCQNLEETKKLLSRQMDK